MDLLDLLPRNIRSRGASDKLFEPLATSLASFLQSPGRLSLLFQQLLPALTPPGDEG